MLELNWSYGGLPVGSLSPFCLIASLTCLVSACPRIRCSDVLSSLLSRFDSIRFDRGLTSLSRRYPDSSSLEFSPSPFLSLSTTSYHPTWRLCEVFFPTTYLLFRLVAPMSSFEEPPIIFWTDSIFPLDSLFRIHHPSYGGITPEVYDPLYSPDLHIFECRVVRQQSRVRSCLSSYLLFRLPRGLYSVRNTPA